MDQSIGLASEIQKAFASSRRIDRGVRQAGFLVLRKTSMPSVLVELGYISNSEEVRFMNSASGQKQLAESLYNAFTKFKREYDRKQGVLTDQPATASTSRPATSSTATGGASSTAKASGGTSTPAANTQKNTTASTSSAAKPGETVHKVQILASDKKLPAGSSSLKGYKADYYVENGMYKYTYGESTDMQEIQKLRQTLAKQFKGAFIVSFRDGEKVK